jgi:hypothetical protein
MKRLYHPMPDILDGDFAVDSSWVTVTEAAEETGYNYHSMRKLIWKIASQPEDEREIKLRKRSYGWELWLPDLMSYLDKPGRGPQGSHAERNKAST